MTETEKAAPKPKFTPRDPLMRFFTTDVMRRIVSTDWRKIKRARTFVVREMTKHYNPCDLGDCVVLFANIQCLEKSKREAKLNAAHAEFRAKRLAGAA